MSLFRTVVFSTAISLGAGAGALAQDIEALSAQDIARDVRQEFNSRTGRDEAVAPSFDPFADDETMAGAVSLRSTNGARDLDGRLLGGGALLDIELYYTREGDAEFARTRDALYLSGEPVSIVMRDSRDVECSSRVRETVYLADRYYGGYRGYGGLTRAHPAYLGSFGFGGGYGHGGGWAPRGYGPGYGYGYGGYHPVAPRPRRPRPIPSTGDGDVPTPAPEAPSDDGPIYDIERYGTTDDSGRGRPALGRDYFRSSTPDKSKAKASTSTGGPAPSPVPRRAPRDPRLRGTPDRRPEPGTRTAPPVRTAPPAPRIRRPALRPSAPAVSRPAPTPRAPDPKPARSAPPVSRPRPSMPKPAPRPAPPARPKAAPKPSRPSVSRDRTHRKRLDMFPQGYGDVAVVSASRDCAVEDRLTLFIPDERLEAARFDGLTLWVRDVAPGRDGTVKVYDERPVFIPPNYIAGFQLARP